MSGYIECPMPGCTGDARYMPPGRGHKSGCGFPGVVTVGIANKDGKRLVDRYADEAFFAMRAENEPEKIFFFPTDPRWEHMWAYVGRPMGYVYEDEGDAPDYVRDCIEFLIEVEYAGTVWYAKQVIHESDLEMANFDIYSFLLDEMVKRVDEYMDGRPNDE